MYLGLCLLMQCWNVFLCTYLCVYRFASKLVYEGKWVGDVPNGKGLCVYPTGHVYDGAWRNGLRHGQVCVSASVCFCLCVPQRCAPKCSSVCVCDVL